VYVPENSAIGKKVAYITAKDPDFGENGNILIETVDIRSDKQFSINRQLAPLAAFNLTSEGFLTISKNLDRESADKYEVEIRACDHGSPKK